MEVKVLDHGYVTCIGYYGSDTTIINAARVSYQSVGKGDDADKKLLQYLWKNKHTSPFEMCKIHFQIKMPIFVMRQYIRHRMQNVNEVSARYTELPNEFYIPSQWRKQDINNKQGSIEAQDFNKRGAIIHYKNPIPNKHGQIIQDVELADTLNETFTNALTCRCREAYATYEMMLSAGVAREMARMVLPVNIYTEFQAMWDLKNLLHFITLRDDSHAQAEIQEYSKAIKSILAQLFPWTMEAYDKYKFVLQEKV